MFELLLQKPKPKNIKRPKLQRRKHKNINKQSEITTIEPPPIIEFPYQYTNIDVFVYCGGKCGSSTLHNTFEKNGLSSIQLHDQYYFRNFLYKNPDSKLTIFDVIDYNKRYKSNIYIIDAYRTPIERKISSFFQNIKKTIPNYMELSVEQLIEIFNTEYIYKLEEYKSIDEVFEYYKLPTFKTFDFNKKYSIFKKDNLTFIKLRFCDIKIWDSILSEIFEINIEMYNKNLTENKNTNQLYVDFKSKYKVPRKYIYRQLMKDVNLKIYNTEIERNEYIAKWKMNMC